MCESSEDTEQWPSHLDHDMTLNSHHLEKIVDKQWCHRLTREKTHSSK